MLNKYRELFNNLIYKIVTPLAVIGLRPWILSIAGLILILIASAIIMLKISSAPLHLSIIIFLAGSLMDGLDGALARMSGQESAWGSFLDSFIDRISELIYIYALGYGGYISLDTAYIYMATSILISYTRSKGEGLNINMVGVGLMERAERISAIIIVLIISIVLGLDLDILFIPLIILNIVTLIERTLYIYRKVKS